MLKLNMKTISPRSHKMHMLGAGNVKNTTKYIVNKEIPSFNLDLSPQEDGPTPASPAEVLTDDLS